MDDDTNMFKIRYTQGKLHQTIPSLFVHESNKPKVGGGGASGILETMCNKI